MNTATIIMGMIMTMITRATAATTTMRDIIITTIMPTRSSPPGVWRRPESLKEVPLRLP